MLTKPLTAFHAHKPHLALVFNATIWGLSWWPYQQLASLGVSVLIATAIAYGLLSLALAAVAPQAVMALLRPHALWPMALAYGLTNTCFNWALATGEVVRVVLLFFLMPLWSALFARLLLGIRLQPIEVGCLLLGLAGSGMVLGLPALLAAGGGAPPSSADLLALSGGLCFGLGNVLLRKAAETSPAERMAGMFLGSGLVPILLLGVLLGAPELPSALALDGLGSALASPWIWMGLIGLASALGLANLGLQYGASRLVPQLASVFMLFEILVATASSAWATGRTPTAWEWLGGGLILLAALLPRPQTEA